MTPGIIFEDAAFLVINKPWGITVNNAETTKNQETVQDYLVSNSKFLVSNKNPNDQNEQEFNSKAGIVHRLDKDTSGVLVVAKTPEAYLNLKLQFQNRQVEKKYLALVHGRVIPPAGVINLPIERNPFNRTKFGVFPNGREAVTAYETAQAFPKFTLLMVSPKTGRTHQIRVHLKHLGHPVVSDPVYGGRKQRREDLKFCPRLFLHAASLTLKHPQSGEVMTFTASLPDELQKVLNLLHGR
jgi:23S rRNA pseudouridine1911/1915/1917 synthase